MSTQVEILQSDVSDLQQTSSFVELSDELLTQVGGGSLIVDY
ncbi:MAG: hypothetical protein ABSF50_07560 [Burkholderiaceae bacterium]|jgi:hypothetical protein